MGLNVITLNELIQKLKRYLEYQDQDGLTVVHVGLDERLRM